MAHIPTPSSVPRGPIDIAGSPKYKTLRSACEVLVVRNTKREQWTFNPQAYRKHYVELYT